MTISFIRSFFLIISGVVGYYIGTLIEMNRPVLGLEMPLLGAMLGCLCGLLLILIELKMQRVSVRGLSSMVFGLLLGLFMAKLLADTLSLLPLGDFVLSVSRIILTLVFSYLGAVMALRGKDEFNVIIPYVRFRRQDIEEGVILLDTSAIIDGRISDIYKIHFLAGRLVASRFVLIELQALADSVDEIKRQKGRRGLELLQLMQDDPKVDLHVHEDELTDDSDVDAKLVRLSKIMNAKICTTDFNLEKIASLQGIEVLNINELAVAVKSVVYTGEELEVVLMKEGKEANQALAYLEDGTMVVVADAKKMIGQKVKISVTSILQTQSGKIIFAKIL